MEASIPVYLKMTKIVESSGWDLEVSFTFPSYEVGKALPC